MTSSGVSFKFLQAQPSYSVYITADVNDCPNVFSGHFMCGTVGSSFTSASDVDFSSSQGAIGDVIDVVCDGTTYYATGSSAHAGGLFVNDC